MQTVLITGATGFLGSYLTKALVGKYNIIILKRSFSDTAKIADVIDKVRSYDIDKVSLESVFAENTVDIVVHSAVNYGLDAPATDVARDNVDFPTALVHAAMQGGVKVFINTDTFYTVDYGYLKNYSATKSQYRDSLKELHGEMKILNARIGIIFGPGDHLNKFTVVMTQRMIANEPSIDLTLGEQQRDFVYVGEVVDAYLFILENLHLFTENYYDFYVGSGKLITIRGYLELIKSIVGSTSTLNFGALPYRENEMMSPDASTAFIESLGWRPGTTMLDAMTLTVEHEKKKALAQDA